MTPQAESKKALRVDPDITTLLSNGTWEAKVHVHSGIVVTSLFNRDDGKHVVHATDWATDRTVTLTGDGYHASQTREMAIDLVRNH